jgi:polysaccharide pyruvyl transferase WcaK-like protein
VHRTNGQRLEEIIAREKIPANKKLIGVNLRNPGKYGGVCKEQPFDLLVELMDRIALNEENHLVFVPISYNEGDDDRASAEKVRSRMSFGERATVISNCYDAAEIKGIISTVHAAIGVSYHFLLFALSCNVPAVGLFSDEYYRRKNTGLFELYDMQRCCIHLEKPEGISSAVSLLEGLDLNNGTVREKLTKKNLELVALNRSSWI